MGKLIYIPCRLKSNVLLKLVARKILNCCMCVRSDYQARSTAWLWIYRYNLHRTVGCHSLVGTKPTSVVLEFTNEVQTSTKQTKAKQCERRTGKKMLSSFPSPVHMASKRTVKPSTPRSRSHILFCRRGMIAMFLASYIQKGLLFEQPPFTTDLLIDHLAAALADVLGAYYPIAGRFITEKQYRDGDGDIVVGCSVSIDCGRQGAEIIHAVADDVAPSLTWRLVTPTSPPALSRVCSR